ncbi:hypothetical protein MRX96_057358 [Rhipicephalus microplus]
MTDAILNGTDPSLPTSMLYSTLPILHSTLVSIKYKEETIPATQSIKNTKHTQMEDKKDYVYDRCNGPRCSVIVNADTQYELLVRSENMTDVPKNCSEHFEKLVGSRRLNQNKKSNRMRV